MRGRLFAGRYHLIAKLRKGGSGTVYKARHVFLNEVVALKVLRSNSFSVRHEATVTAALHHPAFVQVYDAGTCDDGSFICMELLEGRDLRAEIAAGPVAHRRALPIAIQIADGLRFAHSRGVVHGDFAPSNGWITPDDKVKILDLGLARRMPVRRSETLSGTLPYMAPECFERGVVDPCSDQYALGVVLYELLTGKHPHGDDGKLPTRAEVLRRARGSVPPPSSPHICPELLAVIARAMAGNPSRRFLDLGELAEALRRLGPVQ